jgi:hypothetical protein
LPKTKSKEHKVEANLGFRYRPHANQDLMHQRLVPTKVDIGPDGRTKIIDYVNKPKATIFVVRAGRGFGKGVWTTNDMYRLYVQRIHGEIPSHLHPAFNMWGICPSYNDGEQQWLDMKFYAPTSLVVQPGMREQTKDITLFGDGLFEQRSWAKNEGKGLESTGLDAVWITEATRLPRDIWEKQIRPMLRRHDRLGHAYIESKPRDGADFFYDLEERGRHPSEEHIASWQWTAFDNPLLTPDEVADIWNDRETMSEASWQQEYMAERLEGETQALRNIENCFAEAWAPEEAQPGRSYSLGIDLGRSRSRTCITVGDVERRRVVNFFRLDKQDWPLQKEFIMDVMRRYPGMAKMDGTGLGIAIVQDIQYAGFPVEAVIMEGNEKNRLYTQAQLALEKETIKVPKEFHILKEELVHMRNKPTAHGYKSWYPDTGWRDDAADSFVLMLDGLRPAGMGTGAFQVIPSRDRFAEARDGGRVPIGMDRWKSGQSAVIA